MGRTWIRTDTERQRLEEAQREVLRQALREADATTPLRRERDTPCGDRRAMRGVPVIAKGVSTTLPGTSPLAALVTKEAREETRRNG